MLGKTLAASARPAKAEREHAKRCGVEPMMPMIWALHLIDEHHGACASPAALATLSKLVEGLDVSIADVSARHSCGQFGERMLCDAHHNAAHALASDPARGDSPDSSR
jgi:hypothetical protein